MYMTPVTRNRARWGRRSCRFLSSHSSGRPGPRTTGGTPLSNAGSLAGAESPPQYQLLPPRPPPIVPPMSLLTESDVASLLNPDLALSAVEAGLRALTAGEAVQ